MTPRRRAWLTAATVLLGIGLAGGLVARVGAGAILGELAAVGPGILWLFLAYAVGTLVGAFPWTWLLPGGSRPPLRAAVASRFAASGANIVLPFFGMGGEPCRLLWLPPGDRSRGLAAMIVDRALFSAASALFLVAGVLCATTLPGRFAAIGLFTAGGTLALSIGLVVIGRSHGFAGLVERVLRTLRRRPSTAAAPASGPQVDAALARLVRGSPARLGLALGTHLVGRVLLGLETWAAIRVLHIPAGVEAALVLAAVPVALSFAGAFVPGQLGLQEGAQALVCGAMGIDPAAGMALVLLQRIRQVAFVGLAGLLIARARSHPLGPEVARGDPLSGRRAAPDQPQ